MADPHPASDARPGADPRWARPLEAAAVAAFVAYVVWPLLFRDGFVTTFDTLTYTGPLTTTTYDAVADGRLAQWNPDLFGGTVQLANPQAGVLYPLRAALWWLGPQRAIEVLAALHVALFAAGAYVLGWRRLRLVPPAAGVLAVVAVGCGAVQARSLQSEQIAVLAWLPWVLVGIDAVLGVRRHVGRAVAGTAVAAALLLVAGHPQQVVISAFVIAAWTVARTVDHAAPRRLVGVALAGALALGLAAAQLVPTALQLDDSAVGERTIEAAASPNLSAKAGDLPGTLLGAIFLDRTDLTSDAYEAMGWVGAAALVLALVGAGASLGVRGRRATAAVLVLTATMGVVLALGPQCAKTPTNELTDCHDSGGVYRTLYEVVPGLGSERAPARWMLAVGVAVAVLAGLGVDAVRRREVPLRGLGVAGALGVVVLVVLVGPGEGLPPGATSSTTWSWVVAGALAAAAAGAARARPATVRTAASALAVVAVAVELVLPASHSVSRQIPTTTSFDELGLGTTQWLDDHDGRVLALVEERFDDTRYLVGGLRPNANGLSGVRAIDGYDGGMMVTEAWVEAMRGAITGDVVAEFPLRWQIRTPVDPVLLARWGVRYALVDANGRGSVPRWGPVLARDEILEVRENPAYIGDAFVVFATVEGEGPTITVDLPHLPADTVMVPPGGPALECDGDACDPVPVEVERPTPEELRLRVDTPDGGLLVVTESHQPGWLATVDGRTVPTVTADGMNIGVVVPPGAHDVVLRYRTPGLRVGLAVSAAAGVVVALLASGLGSARARRTAARRLPRWFA